MKNNKEEKISANDVPEAVTERDKRCMEKYSSGMSETEICRSENISRQMLRNIFYKAGAFRRIAFEKRKKNELKNYLKKALVKAQELNRIPYNHELKEIEIPARLYKEIKDELKKREFRVVNPKSLNKIKDEELLNELKRLRDMLSRTPGIQDINKFGKYDSTVYYTHFGSLSRAQQLAGLAPTRIGAPKRRNKRDD